MHPIRIAQVIPHFYPCSTGPANALLSISKRLLKCGFEVCIFTSDFGAEKNPRQEIVDGVEVRRFPITRSFMQYFVTPQIKVGIAQYQPDVVHAHNYRSYQTEVSYDFCKRSKRPLIISLNGTAGGYKHMSMISLAKLPYFLYDKFRGLTQLKNASALIVNSSSEERDTKLLLGEWSYKVVDIPIGCEIHQRRALQHDPTILVVERITRDRDPCPIIRALSRARLRYPDIKLKVIGGEVQNSYAVRGRILPSAKSLVSALNMQEAVSFPGELHGSDLEKEYSSADLFVYNSRYENFGLPLLEAASYGIPIITTNVGIAQELIEDGIDGLIVTKTNDVNEIAEKIEFLLGNRVLMIEMGERIRLKATRLFNWDNIVSKYVSLYKHILAKSAN